jgi:hypothetical protein
MCLTCYRRSWRRLNSDKAKRYTLKYVQAHPDRVAEAVRRYREEHRRELRARDNRKHRELKLAVIAGYGGKCACCKEDNPVFLTIDHINGGGAEDRKRNHGGWGLYTRLQKLGYPKDDYQVLCYNCNLAKGFFGHCPHEDGRV